MPAYSLSRSWASSTASACRVDREEEGGREGGREGGNEENNTAYTCKQSDNTFHFHMVNVYVPS